MFGPSQYGMLNPSQYGMLSPSQSHMSDPSQSRMVSRSQDGMLRSSGHSGIGTPQPRPASGFLPPDGNTLLHAQTPTFGLTSPSSLRNDDWHPESHLAPLSRYRHCLPTQCPETVVSYPKTACCLRRTNLPRRNQTPAADCRRPRTQKRGLVVGSGMGK